MTSRNIWAMSIAWIGAVALLLGVIWPLIQMGNRFDTEDDANMKVRRKQLGHWLSGQGERSWETRLQGVSVNFLHLFNRMFEAKGSIIQDAIWSGLILSPVILVGIQIPVLFGLEVSEGLGINVGSDTADSLVLAITLAFSLSVGSVIGRLSADRPFIVIVIVIVIGLVIGLVIVIVSGSFIGIVLGIVSGRGIVSFPGLALSFGIVIVIGLVLGIGIVIVSGDALFIGIGVGYAGSFVLAYFFTKRHIPVDSLKAMGSSLVFIVIVVSGASLFGVDAASIFWDAIKKVRVEILAFVAFNIFADGISLLETRWVLQMGSRAKVYQLVGLVLLDILLSSFIFLFLPILLGEIRTLDVFLDVVRFRGDRPWLGILFWSTFGTSALFYGFVIAVFLFLLPGHGLSRVFRKVIGPISEIEKRPFTSIAYALSALCVLLAVATGVTGLITSLGGAPVP